MHIIKQALAQIWSGIKMILKAIFCLPYLFFLYLLTKITGFTRM